MKQTLIITEQQDGITLKDYLSQQGYSTTQIKRFKYGGEMTVNGQTATVRQVLKVGDTLTLATDERLETPTFAEKPAEIIFADKYLCSLYKYNCRGAQRAPAISSALTAGAQCAPYEAMYK